MASGSPQNLNQLLALFDNDLEKPDRDLVRKLVEQLQQDYAERGIELKEVSSGFRFQVRADYAEWINRLFTERPQRYSRAFLETLAIIAYRQPITRNEIEDIRGVSVSSGIVKTLQEREWVRVVGHRDVPGKPELLATTREFLDYFNLKKLSELPALSEIKDFDLINPDLFEGIDPMPVPAKALENIPAEDQLDPEGADQIDEGDEENVDDVLDPDFEDGGDDQQEEYSFDQDDDVLSDEQESDDVDADEDDDDEDDDDDEEIEDQDEEDDGDDDLEEEDDLDDTSDTNVVPLRPDANDA
jgi:segregation and condensation protein B